MSVSKLWTYDAESRSENIEIVDKGNIVKDTRKISKRIVQIGAPVVVLLAAAKEVNKALLNRPQVIEEADSYLKSDNVYIDFKSFWKKELPENSRLRDTYPHVGTVLEEEATTPLLLLAGRRSPDWCCQL